MLEIDLEKRFGAFDLRVAFASGAAQVTALFGRSGAGKSSLVKMIAGLERPDRGHIALQDRILFDSAAKIDLPPHRRHIGVVFQDSRLLPHITVRGNLRFGWDRIAPAERFIRFDDVVGLLGLESLLERRPARLSGGEKQRVAIGRALLSSPRLLVLDEPLAALDGARKMELLRYVGALVERVDLPILYVSHAPEEILQVAGHLVLIEDGRVAASGAVEQVMSHADFARAAGSRSLITVIGATIESHDQQRRTSRLGFAGGSLTVPLLDLAVGSAVRARIAADDVILARGPIAGLSVRNQLPGKLLTLRSVGALVDAVVDIGCPLQVEMTADAVEDLDIKPGDTVTVLIKSAAIQAAALSRRPIISESAIPPYI